jgi:putative oxidoreductase
MTIKNYMTEDNAKLLLRLTVGVLILLHGIFKIMNPGAIGFIGGLFNNFYLPAFLAYAGYIGEVVAPIMLIIGYRTKLAAGLISFTLLVAIILAHLGDIFSLTGAGGWGIELQAMFMFTALAIVGLGAGKYSIDKK